KAPASRPLSECRPMHDNRRGPAASVSGETVMELQRVFFVPLILVLVVGSLAWHFGRSRSLLERWAERNGFRILRSEYRYMFRGPYYWTTSKGQTVYRVTVEDKAGLVRNGWVRCGGWWLGLMSDHVEARWDDIPPEPKASMRDRWLDN